MFASWRNRCIAVAIMQRKFAVFFVVFGKLGVRAVDGLGFFFCQRPAKVVVLKAIGVPAPNGLFVGVTQLLPGVVGRQAKQFVMLAVAVIHQQGNSKCCCAGGTTKKIWRSSQCGKGSDRLYATSFLVGTERVPWQR